MNKVDKAEVTRWVTAVKAGLGYNSPRGWRDMSISVNHDGIVDRNANRAAMRNSGAVEMGLPVSGRRLYAHIRRELSRQGVPHYTADRRVMATARVQPNSVTVIDNVDDSLWPESLIKGEVFGYGGAREAYFLSAWDKREFIPVYFFCELPPGVSPRSIAEAREALKPEAVKLAESMGRKVKRQGDIFAIPLKGFTPNVKLVEHDLRVAGTNHRVTEGYDFYNKDGVLVTYARGKLQHRPRNRRPDHRTVRLGRKWFLLVKNTVPTVR